MQEVININQKSRYKKKLWSRIIFNFTRKIKYNLYSQTKFNNHFVVTRFMRIKRHFEFEKEMYIRKKYAMDGFTCVLNIYSSHLFSIYLF